MTRQNVTEGVREIMSRPCPTCGGEGVIRSEETIAIEIERRLRDVASEQPQTEAFLVQLNPRVTAEFTGQGSRVLHALERQTGKSFLFEGSEGLALDHFAITFQGTREEVEERALPFRPGDEVLVEIVEPHMYDVDDAVAKIDGYIISIAGAASHVGQKRMVRIDQVGRTAASALLLDDSGAPVAPGAEQSSSAAAKASRVRRVSSAKRAETSDPAASGARARRTRRPLESEDADARREAGLSASPTAVDSEPEDQSADAAGATEAASAKKDSGAGDGLQSKPRRRGRRGGRRRSSAKAKATSD